MASTRTGTAPPGWDDEAEQIARDLLAAGSNFDRALIERAAEKYRALRAAGYDAAAYELLLVQARAGTPIGDPDKDYFGPAPTVGGIPNPAHAINQGLTTWMDGLTSLIRALLDPNNWRRLGLLLAGAVLVILGLVFLAREYLPAPVPGA